MKKLLLALIMSVTASGCATISNDINTEVISLPSGAWVITQTEMIFSHTLSASIRKTDAYFKYHSALYAESVGCPSFSQVSLSVRRNQTAFKCVDNGANNTADILAMGQTW